MKPSAPAPAPLASDLLRRAADEPARREALLDQAFAAAAREGRWLELLRGLRKLGLATPARLDAAITATLDEGQREGAVWCFREVARAEAEDRGDLDAAARALRLGEQAMAARRYPLGFCLLAEEYADTLADEEGARRCLDQSYARSTSLDDLARVATTLWKALGDRAGATALLDGLPTPNDASEAWTLGNALIALERAEEAPGVLFAALDRLQAHPEQWADPVQQALTFARAAASWGQRPPQKQALALAEALASTPDALLDVVETCFTLGDRSPLARRALAEAERRASAGRRGKPRALDEGLRARLVPLALWLGDEEAAKRLAPSGLRPEQLATSTHALPGFVADPSGLLDHLRGRLREEQLAFIARADYGFETSLHLAHLQQIVQTGRVPPVLRWEPGEVLRLCRWSDGEDTDHAIRAFCATVLLMCSDQDYVGNDAVILVESALCLGDPLPERSMGLLAWRAETLLEWQVGERVAALWALALLVAARDPGDPRLHRLADTLETLGGEEAWEVPMPLSTALQYTLKERLWDHLIDRLLRPHAERPAIARILALR